MADEGRGYAERAAEVLRAAEQRARGAGGRFTRESTYLPFDWDAILGDYDAAVNRYVARFSVRWEATWTEGMAHALDLTPYEAVGTLDIRPSDYDRLVADSRAIVDYDRQVVSDEIAAAIDLGESPGAVAQRLMDAQAFTPERAFRIGRTETLRAQESGYQRRLFRAAANGVPIIGDEWMSDPLAAQWPRRHDLLDGVVVPLGGVFRYPSGVTTAGPGLSGVPGEDISCRCARRAKLAPRQ